MLALVFRNRRDAKWSFAARYHRSVMRVTLDAHVRTQVHYAGLINVNPTSTEPSRAYFFARHRFISRHYFNSVILKHRGTVVTSAGLHLTFLFASTTQEARRTNSPYPCVPPVVRSFSLERYPCPSVLGCLMEPHSFDTDSHRDGYKTYCYHSHVS